MANVVLLREVLQKGGVTLHTLHSYAAERLRVCAFAEGVATTHTLVSLTAYARVAAALVTAL